MFYKKIFSTILLTLLVGASFAQNSDSLAFISARRHKLKMGKAQGYTISTTIFDVPQYISIVKFSPKHFSLGIIQPEELTRTSTMGEEANAQLAINAAYWAASKKRVTNKPLTFVKINGEVMSKTDIRTVPRVNGLLLMNEQGIEIVVSEDAPDYPTLENKLSKYDNVLACGPALIDDGKKISYEWTKSGDEILKRKFKSHWLRNPRSAIGRDAAGNIYFIVVDGRHQGKAMGMTVEQLTELCSWLGLVDALNLDGGRSSTLWSRKYGVINYPSANRQFDHEGERRVSSVIIAKKRKR